MQIARERSKSLCPKSGLSSMGSCTDVCVSSNSGAKNLRKQAIKLLAGLQLS